MPSDAPGRETRDGLSSSRRVDDLHHNNAERVILLVEDNTDDVFLTVRAFKKIKIANAVIVAHDGQEALDYLFGTGLYAARDASCLPEVVILDLQLPRVS